MDFNVHEIGRVLEEYWESIGRVLGELRLLPALIRCDLGRKSHLMKFSYFSERCFSEIFYSPKIHPIFVLH